MTEMSIIELFEVGKTFESTVGEGTKSERARIPKNFSRIDIPQEIVYEIQGIDYEINFLVSGEIWCPDYQLNASVLKNFCNLNTNFNMSVITMARGKKYLSSILEIEKENFKGPTIVVMDKNFNVLGIFEERPHSVKELNFEDIKLEYYKGHYLLDTVKDILHIIKK